MEKQQLREQLKNLAGQTIYQRGVSYFRMGAVERIHAVCRDDADIIIISGEVSGAEDYQTELVFDMEKDEFSGLECSCPYEFICKHAVALGLAFTEMYEECEDDYLEIKSYPDLQGLADWIEDNDPPVQIQQSMYAKKHYKREYKLPDYFIRINTQYRHCIATLHHKSEWNQQASPAQLLKNIKDLTPAQKELLTLLKAESSNFRAEIIPDYGRLIPLLQKAGIPVYLENYLYWQDKEKQARFEDASSKLRASLEHKTIYNEYYDYTKHSFIFKISREYAGDDHEFYFSGSHILHIEHNTIRVYAATALLIGIISRIEPRIRYCEFGKSEKKEEIFETELTDQEIIKLNDIIKDGREYLDFRTKLEPRYKIEEYAQADPIIEIDYNAKEGRLLAKPMIDYGCWRTDVSETVFASKRNGRRIVNRRQDFFHPNERIMVYDGATIAHALIQENEEKKLFRNLQARFGFSKTLKLKRKGQNAVFDFYQAHWPDLKKYCESKDYGIVFAKDEFSFARSEFKADVNVDLQSDNDWLGFDLACYCGKDQVTIKDLRLFIEKGLDFIALKDGRLLHITNRKELERFVQMLESFNERENGGFEGKLYHAPELEYVITSSSHYNAQLAKSFTAFTKQAQSGKPVKKVRLPARFKRALRDYQEKGIDWLYFLRTYRFAGILADDMGLGKTIQALVLLELEKAEHKPSIVICPKTLLYNWQIEAGRFAPGLKVLVVDGLPSERNALIKQAKNYDLIITGYATLKKDQDEYAKRKIVFNYAVLDEAQFIKNHATKNAQIVKKINADYRLALTGTPLENSVSEVWSIFDFLMPGFLGSYKSFAKRFHNPIMKRGDLEALRILRKKIECFMLRRSKQEVLKELPPKVEQISYCHLGKAQNVLYQEILERVKGEVFKAVSQKGFDQARIHILAGLTKLRQVCNHPVLLLKDRNYTKYESAKLEMFKDCPHSDLSNAEWLEDRVVNITSSVRL